MSSDHNPADRRADIDRQITEGAVDHAARGLRELWRRESGSATANFVASRLDQVRDRLPLTKFKLAILRSFTVEPIVPLLRAEAFAYGIDVEVYVGDFNTYVQDLVDGDSPLYRFAPNAVTLAVRADAAAPELSRNFADLSPEAALAAAERVVGAYEQWIAAFRKNSQAALIVHSLERPPYPSFGILDGQSDNGQSGLIRRINRELQRIAGENRGVYILDYDALVARHGRKGWHDERKWLTARMRVSAARLPDMVRVGWGVS
jgi:predicted enzyme involved in methoxymalonyl-ACP biosynthesis